MGFFSWKTADTKESIPAVQSGRPQRLFYMLQPRGAESIVAGIYNGDGIVGGIDVYEWIAVMNGYKTRDEGLDLAYSENPADCYIGPKFSFDKNAVYEELPLSETCPYQGFFYD